MKPTLQHVKEAIINVIYCIKGSSKNEGIVKRRLFDFNWFHFTKSPLRTKKVKTNNKPIQKNRILFLFYPRFLRLLLFVLPSISPTAILTSNSRVQIKSGSIFNRIFNHNKRILFFSLGTKFLNSKHFNGYFVKINTTPVHRVIKTRFFYTLKHIWK